LVLPTPPHNVRVFESEIATYWFDHYGILVSVSKTPKRTIENITNNIALVKQITGNRIVPLLIYLSNSPVPDKQTRKFASEVLPSLYSAMAMVTHSNLGKFIMNILFRFNTPPIPMKTFANDKEAKQWLKQFL
jgi:hypothetical protein